MVFLFTIGFPLLFFLWLLSAGELGPDDLSEWFFNGVGEFVQEDWDWLGRQFGLTPYDCGPGRLLATGSEQCIDGMHMRAPKKVKCDALRALGGEMVFLFLFAGPLSF